MIEFTQSNRELENIHPEWKQKEPFALVLKDKLESALSDGDFQMLEWTTTGPGPRFAMIDHHDDAERESAYDRESHIGKLDKGLDEGSKRGWSMVSMKDDWKSIHPDFH